MHISLAGILLWRYLFRGVKYSTKLFLCAKQRKGLSMWWCHIWTPVWHKGRGPYITIGLGRVAFYRGY